MIGWNELLGFLAEVPRENGTEAVHRAADFLAQAMATTGAEVIPVPFTAYPYALRIIGVVFVVGAAAYFWLMRAGRGRAVLSLSLLLPVLLTLDSDGYLPVFSFLGGEQAQRHVVGRVPVERPEQRLIFTAHYDTKTDLLDHVERAPVELVTPLLTLLMIAGGVAAIPAPRSKRGRGLKRFGTIVSYAAVVHGLAFFLVLTAGAVVPGKSPGALDNGGSCAVLVRLAGRLARAPGLQRTEVELITFSAEEVGVQGSRAYARARFARPPEIPTYVINLEGMGAAGDLAVLGSERTLLNSYEPDPRIVSLLAAVYREQRGAELEKTWYGGATDGRSFLDVGVPAATLLGREPDEIFLRDLHSAADSRKRVSPAALEAAVELLHGVASRADREGIGT